MMEVAAQDSTLVTPGESKDTITTGENSVEIEDMPRNMRSTLQPHTKPDPPEELDDTFKARSQFVLDNIYKVIEKHQS